MEFNKGTLVDSNKTAKSDVASHSNIICTQVSGLHSAGLRQITMDLTDTVIRHCYCFLACTYHHQVH